MCDPVEMTYFVGAESSYAPAQRCIDTSYPPSVHMHLGFGIAACEETRRCMSFSPANWASLDTDLYVYHLLEPSQRTAESLSNSSIENTNEQMDLRFD